jgi:hypothetical protein
MAAHVLDQQIGLRRGIVAAIDEGDRRFRQSRRPRSAVARPCLGIPGDLDGLTLVAGFVKIRSAKLRRSIVELVSYLTRSRDK